MNLNQGELIPLYRKTLQPVLAVLLVLVTIAGFVACGKEEEQPTIDNIQENPSMANDSAYINEKAYRTELVEPTTPTTTQAPTTEVTEAPTEPTTLPVLTDTPTTLVIEGQTASSAFFNDAVFIGDSISLMLSYYVADQRNYGDCLGTAKFLTSGSLGSAEALLPVSSDSLHPTYQGQKMLLEDSVALIGAKKVFIMLGMNDIALYGIEGALDYYEELVGTIRAKTPDAVIYAQSCTPIIKGKERSVLNNSNIRSYNAALQTRCANNGWNYLDLYSVVSDSEGYLLTEYCSDPDGMGMHFTNAGCHAWIEYLLTHVG